MAHLTNMTPLGFMKNVCLPKQNPGSTPENNVIVYIFLVLNSLFQVIEILLINACTSAKACNWLLVNYLLVVCCWSIMD